MQEIGSLRFRNQDDLFIKGQFGTRFKGKLHQTLDAVIEKIERKYFRIECETLFPPPNHPNILCYFIEADVEFLYVSSLLSGGTLKDYVLGRHDSSFAPNQDFGQVLSQVAEGLNFLHGIQIVHRNLKPSSIKILLPDTNGKMEVKLGDYGVSRIPKQNTSFSLLKIAGSKSWMPPEAYYATAFTPEMDVFSFGLVMGFALFKGNHPYGLDKEQRVYLIKKGEPMMMTVENLDLPAGVAAGVYSLIKSLLIPDPQLRPDMSSVLNHWFFNSARAVTSLSDASSFGGQIKGELTDEDVVYIATVPVASFSCSCQNNSCSTASQQTTDTGIPNETQWYFTPLPDSREVAADQQQMQMEATNTIVGQESNDFAPFETLESSGGVESSPTHETAQEHMSTALVADSFVQGEEDYSDLAATSGVMQSQASESTLLEADELPVAIGLLEKRKRSESGMESSRKRIETEEAGPSNLLPVPDAATTASTETALCLVAATSSHQMQDASVPIDTSFFYGHNLASNSDHSRRSDRTREQPNVQYSTLKRPVRSSSVTVSERRPVSRPKGRKGGTIQVLSSSPKPHDLNVPNALAPADSQNDGGKDSSIPLPLKADKIEEQRLLDLCRQSSLTEAELTVVRNLVSNKHLNVNIKVITKWETPILLLCRHNQSSSLLSALQALLVRKDINLTLRDPLGRNLLCILARYYHNDSLIDCAQLLIQRGVSVNAVDNKGKFAFEMLAKYYRGSNLVQIFLLLFKKNSDQNALASSVETLHSRRRYDDAKQLWSLRNVNDEA